MFVFLILSFWCSKAQGLDPLKDSNEFAQKKWVDSVFSSMSIDEKIGQLFTIWVATKQGPEKMKEVSLIIKKNHLLLNILLLSIY